MGHGADVANQFIRKTMGQFVVSLEISSRETVSLHDYLDHEWTSWYQSSNDGQELGDSPISIS